jgi:hypothetical protein
MGEPRRCPLRRPLPAHVHGGGCVRRRGGRRGCAPGGGGGSERPPWPGDSLESVGPLPIACAHDLMEVCARPRPPCLAGGHNHASPQVAIVALWSCLLPFSLWFLGNSCCGGGAVVAESVAEGGAAAEPDGPPTNIDDPPRHRPRSAGRATDRRGGELPAGQSGVLAGSLGAQTSQESASWSV